MTLRISFDVSGRHVLITGGCGGIGSAFAQAFVAAGAEVTATDIKSPPPEFSKLGVRVERLDVVDDNAVEALAGRIRSLDVLIHCAGFLAPFKEHRIDVFQKVVDVHLFASMRLAAAFRGHLAASRGCIINIASIYSYFGNDRVPAYAAAKAAVVSLTKSLAIAYADEGIRVNAIAPGWTDTEMTKGGKNDAAFNAKVMDRLPSKRWADPMELAGTALFLASPASALVNGVTIPVDGGYVAT
jgi:NAD(P)-dependent dehydrogenase (short-subunit alcohol dehydrogenase family)